MAREIQEQSYLNLLREIMSEGFPKEGRNGLTWSLFGRQIRFQMSATYGQRGGYFPLLTTKRVSFHNIIGELLWFLRGETNIRSLQAQEIHIWDEWADANGDLGPVYGSQWRNFGGDAAPLSNGTFAGGGVDQIAQVFEALKKDPNGRRHVVSAWNPKEVPNMALPPCHMSFQFYVQGSFLSLHMYQRSADIFLGVPYNIASYATLLHIFAYLLNKTAHELIISFGDVHLYATHRDQAEEQIKRLPVLPSPYLVVDPRGENTTRTNPWDFVEDDFYLGDYNPLPALRAPVSV